MNKSLPGIDPLLLSLISSPSPSLMVELFIGAVLLRRVGSNQTLATSYDIFTRLRERGIRAHSWV